MTHTINKIVVATTSLVLGLTAINANPSQAATITYDFAGTIDSGSLLGQSYSGFLSFDDSTLAGTGRELLAVSEIELNFLSTTFSETDDFASEPQVEFLDNNFLGLSLFVEQFEPQFSFSPGFFAIEEAVFAYEPTSGESGFGDVNYTLRQSEPPSSIPETSSRLSLWALAALMVNSLRGRKQ